MVSFNTADEFFDTMAAGGKAMRLEDIKGIGPKTANKINNVREIRGIDDVKDMSADELSDKANISYSRAKKAISGVGGNPNVSKAPRSTGSVSAAGARTRTGDFWTDFTTKEQVRARNDARSRSERAVREDERKRAPITTDKEQWQENPDRWDYPGVDTPTNNPKVLPKDYAAGGEFETADFDSKGQAEYDKQQQETYPRKKRGGRLLETGEERLLASDVANEGPMGTIPGLAPRDVEDDVDMPAFDIESKRMGWRPSYSRLSKDAEKNLAKGEEADMAFMGAEQQRQANVMVEETHSAVADFLEGGSQREYEARMQELNMRF